MRFADQMDWALVKCEVFTGNLMREMIEPSRKDGELGFSLLFGYQRF